MTLQLLAVLSLALSAGDGNEDLGKLQGTWKTVTLQEGDTEPRSNPTGALEFSTDEVILKAGTETIYRAKITIDSSKKPHQIDLQITHSKRDKLIGKKQLGIYEIDGDSLKWCVSKPGDTERPKEFDSGTSGVMATLKRQAP